MLQNNNKNKRIFSAILLSMAILIAAKGFENKIINDKSNDMNNNSGIFLDDNEYTDTSIIEDEVLNAEENQEEQNAFTEEELRNMMVDGTVIIKQQGHYQSYVYCIKIGSSVRFPDGILGIVPNGYQIYEELKSTYGEDNQVIYVRTGVYRTVEKEQSKSRIKIIK